MEYININKLKQDIIDSWKSNNHKGYAASRIHNQEHRDLMLIVERQPTMDAVSKEKYQQLQHKYNLAVAEREANVKGFTEDLAKAKTEVAREIFAELLKEASLRFDGFRNTIIFPLDYYNELKKKYTEGEKENG